MLPCEFYMGAFSIWEPSLKDTGYTGRLATTGLEEFSNASIRLERIFSKASSMNDVHFYVTLKLPVVRGISVAESAFVQAADSVNTNKNNDSKKVEGILRELSNEDGKFACTGSPGGTGKGMSADLQGGGLTPATVEDGNPAL